MQDLRKNKTLYLASWGNNNGHIIHCVALGSRAVMEGWRVVIATQANPSHISLIRDSGMEPAVYPLGAVPDDLWLCWQDESFIKAAVDTDISMMRDAQANAVVHDIRFSAPIAAAELGLKSAAVCHQPDFLGFKYPGLNIMDLWTKTRPVQNILAALGQKPLQPDDLRALLLRDILIIPSMPEFDPLTDDIPEVLARYVGPLSLPALGAQPETFEVGEPDEGIFFYRIVGSNDGIRDFCKVFADLGNRVIIATGDEESAQELRSASEGTGFQISALWDMEAVSRSVNLFVHHGGPGTCLSSLEAGVPSVVIPGDHPERCLYADRMESLGVGISLSAGANPKTVWAAAVDTTAVMPAWIEVRRQVDRARTEPSRRQTAKSWQRRLRDFGGGTTVAALQDLLGSPDS